MKALQLSFFFMFIFLVSEKCCGHALLAAASHIPAGTLLMGGMEVMHTEVRVMQNAEFISAKACWDVAKWFSILEELRDALSLWWLILPTGKTLETNIWAVYERVLDQALSVKRSVPNVTAAALWACSWLEWRIEWAGHQHSLLCLLRVGGMWPLTECFILPWYVHSETHLSRNKALVP